MSKSTVNMEMLGEIDRGHLWPVLPEGGAVIDTSALDEGAFDPFHGIEVNND